MSLDYRSIYWLFAALLFVLSGCQLPVEEHTTTAITRPLNSDPFSEVRTRWVRVQQFESVSAADVYHDQGIFIRSAKEWYTAEQINDYLQTRRAGIGKVDSLGNPVVIPATDSISYELGSFFSEGREKGGYVFVWRQTPEGYFIELEACFPYDSTRADINAIDRARERWIALCNAHQAAGLVSEMYLPDAIYYSHRPPVVGTDAIGNEYDYMNRQRYQLDLDPLKIRPVSGDIVFEIGQCSGSYGGKYLIIWQQNAEGQWQVLLDSNV